MTALPRRLGRSLAVRIADAAAAERERRVLAACRSVGELVHLRMPVTVYAPEMLTLGDQVEVGEYVVLRAGGGLTIGNRVLIAAHAIVTTRGHPEDIPRWGRVVDEPVTIGDDVWIGAGAIVLPGVDVGRGAVVAAGAVVTRSVDPFTVAAGVPARPVKALEGVAAGPRDRPA